MPMNITRNILQNTIFVTKYLKFLEFFLIVAITLYFIRISITESTLLFCSSVKLIWLLSFIKTALCLIEILHSIKKDQYMVYFTVKVYKQTIYQYFSLYIQFFLLFLIIGAIFYTSMHAFNLISTQISKYRWIYPIYTYIPFILFFELFCKELTFRYAFIHLITVFVNVIYLAFSFLIYKTTIKWKNTRESILTEMHIQKLLYESLSKKIQQSEINELSKEFIELSNIINVRSKMHILENDIQQKHDYILKDMTNENNVLDINLENTNIVKQQLYEVFEQFENEEKYGKASDKFQVECLIMPDKLLKIYKMVCFHLSKYKKEVECLTLQINLIKTKTIKYKNILSNLNALD